MSTMQRMPASVFPLFVALVPVFALAGAVASWAGGWRCSSSREVC